LLHRRSKDGTGKTGMWLPRRRIDDRPCGKTLTRAAARLNVRLGESARLMHSHPWQGVNAGATTNDDVHLLRLPARESIGLRCLQGSESGCLTRMQDRHPPALA
jgi:hypothetical protein